MLPKASIYFGFCNFIGALFLWISMFPKEDWGKNFLLLIGTAFLFGCIAGGWIKYRSRFSVAFSLILISYFLIIFPVVLIGSGALVFADIAGIPEIRVEILLIYLISITFPLAFGMICHFKKLSALRSNNLNSWREAFPGVDFEKYTIIPDESGGEADTDNVRATMWATGAMAVNIPLFFESYFGSKNNLIFIIMPVMIGMFTYYGFKKVGPLMVKLYILRQYEKQTNRRFINADYEKIQELRRTFFLSRWLMKDYRRTAGQ